MERGGGWGKGGHKENEKKGGPNAAFTCMQFCTGAGDTVCFRKNKPLANMQDQNTSQACTVVLTVMHTQFEITASYTRPGNPCSHDDLSALVAELCSATCMPEASRMAECAFAGDYICKIGDYNCKIEEPMQEVMELTARYVERYV